MSRGRGLALAAVSAAAFGSAGVCAKVAMAAGGAELTPLRTVQFRITGAAVILHLILAVVRRRNPGRPRIRWSRSTVVTFLAYGLIAFVCVQSLYFLAITRLPVGVALLIEYLAPGLVALWVALVQGRRQPPATWLGIGLALLGLALIARPWQGFVLDGIGVLAALTAATALAAYFLIADSRSQDSGSPLDLCAWAATFGAAALALVQPWWTFPWPTLGRSGLIRGYGVPVWALLGEVILIGTVLSYLAGIAALAHLPTPVAAVVATTEVLVAAVAAWAALGERLTAPEIVGGVMLLSGAALAQRRRADRAPDRRAPARADVVTP